MPSIIIKVIFPVVLIPFIRSEFVVSTCGQVPVGHENGASVYDGLESIYFMGGRNVLNELDTVVCLNIATHESEIVGRFPVGIYMGAAGMDGDGNIFFFGGTSGGFMQSTIYKLNGSNPAPVAINDLQQTTYGMAAVSVGMDSIFLVGGFIFSSGYSREITHYNTAANSLELVAELPTGIWLPVAVYDGENIFIFGGYTEGMSANRNIYKFDPIRYTVVTLDILTPTELRIQTASYIGNNQTIIINTYNYGSNATKFTRFHHDTGSLEELQEDFLQGKLGYPVSVYVPKNKKLYFHGSSVTGMKSVYCIDFSEDYGVECPAEGLAFLPNPTDCSKYFICNDGEAFPAECLEGLLFDPELGSCNIAEEVDCPILQCPPEGVSYLPVIGNCTQYILCIFGEGTLQECVEGTEFSTEEQGCVLDANYECPYTMK